MKLKEQKRMKMVIHLYTGFSETDKHAVEGGKRRQRKQTQ